MGPRELRKTYPEFVYKGYEYELKNGDLRMSFDFEVPPDIRFRARVVVRSVPKHDLKQLDTIVFHLGLAEMPSYWKATASRTIRIEAGPLNKTQTNWWHNLFMEGMGEYFYKNKIDFTKSDFLIIEAKARKGSAAFTGKLADKILVPIGGGKDAIVTYEVLKANKQVIQPFVLNPRKEQLRFLEITGDRGIVADRTIDPKLLELNRKGYLNGHTPFSAYLAFLTVLCAALFDYKYIAVSNERSSNEGNTQFRGQEINHQYSKSFEFEKKFRSYSEKYLAKNVEYFSFLRPLYELQIAKLFSAYPQYVPVFLSCNEAHKTDSGRWKPTGKWCGTCSKCLFVFTSLYPFIETRQLVKIFGRNLFADKTLVPLMEELVGERNFKPFECVGTVKESLVAFYLALQKTHAPLPPLLKHFRKHIAKKHTNLPQESRKLLSSWNKQHALCARLENHLRSVLP